MNTAWRYGDEVARAFAAKTPVVALETTVVTHGLPHPEGVRTARSLEEAVRGLAPRRRPSASSAG
jgi:pseudouridine-5'-phosphate glycosidase